LTVSEIRKLIIRLHGQANAHKDNAWLARDLREAAIELEKLTDTAKC
jgi:hypothetical protein